MTPNSRNFPHGTRQYPSTIITWAATRLEPLGSSWFRGSPAHGGCWHIGPNKNNSTHTSHNVRITALFIISSRQKAYVQSTWQAKQFPPVHCKLQGIWTPGQVALSRKAGMPKPEVEKICEKGKHALFVSCCNKEIYHSPFFRSQDSNSDYFLLYIQHHTMCFSFLWVCCRWCSDKSYFWDLRLYWVTQVLWKQFLKGKQGWMAGFLLGV